MSRFLKIIVCHVGRQYDVVHLHEKINTLWTEGVTLKGLLKVNICSAFRIVFLAIYKKCELFETRPHKPAAQPYTAGSRGWFRVHGCHYLVDVFLPWEVCSGLFSWCTICVPDTTTRTIFPDKHADCCGMCIIFTSACPGMTMCMTIVTDTCYTHMPTFT